MNLVGRRASKTRIIAKTIPNEICPITDINNMTKRVLAIGGGKGGVGKSLVASNLAIAMAQLGKDVVLVDADLGGANLHTIFGMDRPRFLLEQFIGRDVENLEQILLPTAQKGLRLICGGMPVLGTANPKFAQKQRLINHIKKLETEIIILDTGAGAGFNVLDLFNAADKQLVVFTPQLTSLHNGYGFLKAAILRALQRAISAEARKFLSSSGPETAGESLEAALSRLLSKAPEESQKVNEVLQRISISIVGNMLRSRKEDPVMGAISKMVQDHLQIEAPVIGLIRYGEKLLKSVNDRRPFMFWAGIESNAETFRNLAVLLSPREEEHREEPESRIEKASEHTNIHNQNYERKEPRYPIHCQATLQRNAKSYLGRLSNVAYGGGLVIFDTEIDNTGHQAIATLVIGPTRDGETITLKVEERHRDPSGKKLGFAFHIVDDEDRASLDRLVAYAAASTAMSGSGNEE